MMHGIMSLKKTAMLDAELHITVNNIKILSVAQKCFYGNL